MIASIKDVFTVNNIVNFSHHSSRTASSGIAKCIDVSIKEIIRRGGWKNRKTLFKYYEKEITKSASGDIEFIKIFRVWNNVSFFIGIENYWNLLLINLSWIIITWYHPYMHYIGVPTSNYLSVVRQSLNFPQRTNKTRMNTKIIPILTKYEAWWLFIWASHHFNYTQVCTLTSNSLLSMKISRLPCLLECLSLIHMCLTRTNNHKASYLVNICSIFVILENCQKN